MVPEPTVRTLQGSGTYATEAVFTLVPSDARLIVANGFTDFDFANSSAWEAPCASGPRCTHRRQDRHRRRARSQSGYYSPGYMPLRNRDRRSQPDHGNCRGRKAARRTRDSRCHRVICRLRNRRPGARSRGDCPVQQQGSRIGSWRGVCHCEARFAGGGGEEVGLSRSIPLAMESHGAHRPMALHPPDTCHRGACDRNPDSSNRGWHSRALCALPQGLASPGNRHARPRLRDSDTGRHCVPDSDHVHGAGRSKLQLLEIQRRNEETRLHHLPWPSYRSPYLSHRLHGKNYRR